MPIRLAAQSLSIRYSPAAARVLSEFSLDLEAGVFTGIVGPNGSGKSTLIRALSRTLKPADGVVLLDERDLYTGYSARSSAQAIGVVPQDTQVSLGFSVREVVRMGRAPHLPPRPFAAETLADEQIVTDALRAARVDDLAERSVATLSGGERQRVLFARALAQQGEILLLDEPTASLDLRHQAETLTLARDLAHDGGKTVIAVLHDLNQAAAYCDTLVLMHEGQIAAQGLPADVLTSDNLLRVYGTRVWVRNNPASGRPLVLPLPERTGETISEDRPRVHVLCGGGTGAKLLVSLHRLGFRVTAGALHTDDTDAEAAHMLSVSFAPECPFTPLSSAALAQAGELAQDADAVLLTGVPFGVTNLGTLSAALSLCRLGKPVLCLQDPATDFEARDFTGGAAASIWSALLTAGAVPMPSEEAILQHLQQMSVGTD